MKFKNIQLDNLEESGKCIPPSAKSDRDLPFCIYYRRKEIVLTFSLSQEKEAPWGNWKVWKRYKTQHKRDQAYGSIQKNLKKGFYFYGFREFSIDPSVMEINDDHKD